MKGIILNPDKVEVDFPNTKLYFSYCAVTINSWTSKPCFNGYIFSYSIGVEHSSFPFLSFVLYSKQAEKLQLIVEDCAKNNLYPICAYRLVSLLPYRKPIESYMGNWCYEEALENILQSIFRSVIASADVGRADNVRKTLNIMLEHEQRESILAIYNKFLKKFDDNYITSVKISRSLLKSNNE